MNPLEQFFREHELRLTEPRRDVFRILMERDQPMLLGEIIKISQFAERTSVYRTLEIFKKLGIVDIIQVGFKQRYELADPFKPHHHHMVCVKCGELIELDSSRLEKLVGKIASGKNYLLTAHHVELLGICSECQKKEKEKTT